MLVYTYFQLVGILIGGIVAFRLKMPKIESEHKKNLYICAVLGLIIGMKLPVLLSYEWNPSFILNGKSYMGGILGAFVGINLYKLFVRQIKQAFGGRFVIPLAIAAGFGKIGCYYNGCCNGVISVPTQIIESIFQFLMAIFVYIFYKKTQRTDLLFPIYLLVYLIMRFIIEFVRIEPRIIWGLTIYQILSVIFIPIVIIILWRRRHA